MLQTEMDGYLSTRVQLLDQEHCLLDYIRDKANLCCEQAKVKHKLLVCSHRAYLLVATENGYMWFSA